jgi:hypothetical protein
MFFETIGLLGFRGIALINAVCIRLMIGDRFEFHPYSI